MFGVQVMANAMISVRWQIHAQTTAVLPKDRLQRVNIPAIRQFLLPVRVLSNQAPVLQTLTVQDFIHVIATPAGKIRLPVTHLFARAVYMGHAFGLVIVNVILVGGGLHAMMN